MLILYSNTSMNEANTVHALNSLDIAMARSKQIGWHAADDRTLITAKRLDLDFSWKTWDLDSKKIVSLHSLQHGLVQCSFLHLYMLLTHLSSPASNKDVFLQLYGIAIVFLNWPTVNKSMKIQIEIEGHITVRCTWTSPYRWGNLRTHCQV